MLSDYFIQRLSENLPYVPTEEQADLIARLSAFLWDDNVPSVFLLKGYAGTGKTSLIGALVKTLESFERTCVLLAPGGFFHFHRRPGGKGFRFVCRSCGLYDTQEDIPSAGFYGRFYGLSVGA